MMKILLTFFVLFLSYPVFSYEWNLEFLKKMNDGCLSTAMENVTLGEAFEYCGCTSRRIYEEFSLDEVLAMYETETIFSNRTFLKIVENCNKKIGY